MSKTSSWPPVLPAMCSPKTPWPPRLLFPAGRCLLLIVFHRGEGDGGIRWSHQVSIFSAWTSADQNRAGWRLRLPLRLPQHIPLWRVLTQHYLRRRYHDYCYHDYCNEYKYFYFYCQKRYCIYPKISDLLNYWCGSSGQNSGPWEVFSTFMESFLFHTENCCLGHCSYPIAPLQDKNWNICKQDQI